MMTQGFSKLDLVTREEFDIQAQVLAKTRAKLEALELRVAELEAPEPQRHMEHRPAQQAEQQRQHGARQDQFRHRRTIRDDRPEIRARLAALNNTKPPSTHHLQVSNPTGSP
jgi:hypothetical protein